MPRVMIVAQSAVERSGLATLLAANPGLNVVGAVADVASARGAAADLLPDVVLFSGERTLGASGWDPHSEGIRVVVLTSEEEPEGSPGGYAEAVLPVTVSPEEIIAAVYAASAGLSVRKRNGSAAPSTKQARENGIDAALSLTKREREVLAMIAEGLPNKAIAADLGITSHTVKFHIASILSKLGAESRTEAVTIGLRRGLIML